MSTVTWLHLSDFHFRESQSFDQKTVLTKLLDDIEARFRVDNLRPDFIAVTGDIAFSGKSSEYALAATFFDQLLHLTQVPRERIFIIPGNHDVDRSLVTGGAKTIGAGLVNREIVNDVLADDNDRRLVFLRFSGLAQFAERYFGRQMFTSDSFYFVKMMQFAGQSVAIIGLNSAWLSESDSDRNKIAIGERQVREALEQARGASTKIALLHHPFNWLREFDEKESGSILMDNCDLILHGHLHEAEVSQRITPDSTTMVIACGACYDAVDRPQVYNFVQLNLATRRGKLILRRYSPKNGGFWTKDVMTYQHMTDGVYEFQLGLKSDLLDRYKQAFLQIEAQEQKIGDHRSIPLPLLEDKRSVQAKIEDMEIQMVQPLVNPYVNRAKIRKAEDFWGRKKELDRIYGFLSKMQSISIVGDRRIGKSSLLYCLGLPEVQQHNNSRMLSDVVFVYFDSLRLAELSPLSFFRHLLRHLSRQINDRVTLELGDIASYSDVEDFITKVQDSKIRSVFLFDEFDTVTLNPQFDVGFFNFLRYLAGNYDIAIITGSVKPLNELCHSGIDSSPFFNIFTKIELGSLTEDETRQLIQAPAMRAGVSFDEDDVDFVIDLAGCHPLLTQIACYYLFESKGSNKPVNYADIQRDFDLQASDHFEYFWNHMPEEMRRRLAAGIGHRDVQDFHYLAKGSGFRRFVLARSGSKPTQQIELPVDMVKQALDTFDDQLALGQIELAIYLGFSNESQADRGKLVRSVLVQKIETLKPEGKPNYTNSVWWPYLILYERFVSGKSVNDLIKSFPFSRRQFYRELDRATVALAQALRVTTK